MAENDQILKPLVKKYSGLRLIGIPDLFEAIAWAIIGQQINLTFAYTLKSDLSSILENMFTLKGKAIGCFQRQRK